MRRSSAAAILANRQLDGSVVMGNFFIEKGSPEEVAGVETDINHTDGYMRDQRSWYRPRHIREMPDKMLEWGGPRQLGVLHAQEVETTHREAVVGP